MPAVVMRCPFVWSHVDVCHAARFPSCVVFVSFPLPECVLKRVYTGVGNLVTPVKGLNSHLVLILCLASEPLGTGSDWQLLMVVG